MKNNIWYSVLLAVVCAGCTKESFIDSPDARVRFSVERLSFDTLFTSTGSVTKQLKIYNDDEGRLRISDLSLKGGAGSYFQFNADGQPGQAATNLEIAAGDSIYVFVSVKIDPTAAHLPFIISDTLEVNVNGRTHSLPLSAWGQNAFFLESEVLRTDTSWTAERPVVIKGGLLVAKGVTLEIKEGTRVYLHADAPLIIEGRLMAAGGNADSAKIIFQGDRLDTYYRDLPGSWPGFFFTQESGGSHLKNVIIKNAYQGIAAEGASSTPEEKITLDRCMIFNCYDAGVIASGSSIHASNSIVYNCGRNIMLVKGGRYNFVHCTVAATGNAYVPHKQPVLTVADYIRVQNIISFAPVEAAFTNCIFWGSNGSVEEEVGVFREGSEPFDVSFNSCLWKVSEPPESISGNNNIYDEDPMFANVSGTVDDFDLRPRQGSPVINKGTVTGVVVDFDGRARINTPDIGAFESTF